MSTGVSTAVATSSSEHWLALASLPRSINFALSPLANDCWSRLVAHMKTVDAEGSQHFAATFPTNFKPDVKRHLQSVNATWRAYPVEAKAHHQTLNALRGLTYASDLVSLFMASQPEADIADLVDGSAHASVISLCDPVIAKTFSHWKGAAVVASRDRTWGLLNAEENDVVFPISQAVTAARGDLDLVTEVEQEDLLILGRFAKTVNATAKIEMRWDHRSDLELAALGMMQTQAAIKLLAPKVRADIVLCTARHLYEDRGVDVDALSQRRRRAWTNFVDEVASALALPTTEEAIEKTVEITDSWAPRAKAALESVGDLGNSFGSIGLSPPVG